MCEMVSSCAQQYPAHDIRYESVNELMILSGDTYKILNMAIILKFAHQVNISVEKITPENSFPAWKRALNCFQGIS